MRDVPRKKGLLLLIVLSLFLPMVSYAQEEATQVGIGFSQVEPPGKSSPTTVTPVNNVLPATSTTRMADTSKGALPKTGEAQSLRLRFVGLLCLIVCYWLFLFLRMNEEEEHYDKEM